MPKLTVLLGRKTIQVHDIDKSVIRIGREEEMDIIIDNPSVSRRHAEFRRDGEGWVVEDLGSSNGTFMDGNKIEAPCAVDVGGEVGMGKFSIVFGKVLGEGADTAVSHSATPVNGFGGTTQINPAEVQKLLKDSEKKRRAQVEWESGGRRGTHYFSDAPAVVFGTDELADVSKERTLFAVATEDVIVHPMATDLIYVAIAFFLGLVGLVLLIACTNIANLMLARANVRIRELATRLALGADRARLGKQLLTEAVVLGVIGGGLGLLLAYGGIQFLTAFGIQDIPRGAEISLDGTVMLFTLLLGLGAGVLFGAIPLFNVLKSDLNAVFRSESRSGTASRATIWLRNGLVTAQVAIAFVLLIGAGLMLESFRGIVELDPGFKAEGVMAGVVPLPASRYPEAPSRVEFYDRLLLGVRAIPGVSSASLTASLPFGGSNSASVIQPEGYVAEPGESLLSPFNHRVATDYFQTMGISLLLGRTFEAGDHADATQVIILDEWLANRYFPEGEAIGKRMLFGTVPGMEEDDEPFLYTIVGVVGSARQNNLVESSFVGTYYFPFSQDASSNAQLIMKTAGDPMGLVEPARAIITRLDPEVPFYGARTMQERIDDSLMERRSPMLLLAIFAGVALFLAGLGIYGALAYSVAQRTREMGIRIAIGSSSAEVFRLVLGQGVRVVGVGLVVGAVGAFVLGQLIRSLLYGVQPTDFGVMGTVSLVLALTGLVACVLPARRATRIHPVVALTSD
jgi:predicted permease